MSGLVESIGVDAGDLLEPLGMRLVLFTDDVRYVQVSVANVWQNLFIGALLATGVMFLFLGSGRATLVTLTFLPALLVSVLRLMPMHRKSAAARPA